MIQNVEKQFTIKHIPIWPSGLSHLTLHEVISGSNPGFAAFGVFAFRFARVSVLPFAKVELNTKQQLRCVEIIT